ncbi:c-type cytochrome [Paraburkholderia dinghuensis]|uniref:Cytochrome c n=1 Tax=Paraburkholderia dinghuensis TaxID=2305225 RepID=A0A3N6MYC0_9BURK|nr:cytochrome c [Paraburkholderia dinghuensis]RQH08984.1 cytochrome c [Paraburkholderia dinghuensis]
MKVMQRALCAAVVMFAAIQNGNAAAVNTSAGSAVFESQCVVCHQAGATGMEGLAPPLTKMPAVFASSEAGRAHLLHTLLNGMVGPITVDGGDFNFKMPSFAALSDADIANVANYLIFGVDKAPASTKPVTADAVAKARKATLTPDDVYAERAQVHGGGAQK